MTEVDRSWEAAGAAGPSPRRRAALVAGAAVATVVLATVGAVSGWMLAGGDELAGAPAVEETGTIWPASPARTRTEPPAATTPPKKRLPPVGRLVVPDLVGLDFAEAREELRRRKLGWQLVFRTSGSDRGVERTDPPAGRTVAPGVTVRLLVAGAAPPVEVPDVTGEACSRAASRLVDDGLYPNYPGGRAGVVLRQDPAPGRTLRWNDHVRIYCGKAPAGEPTTAPAY